MARKISLILLFALSLSLVAITLYRVVEVVHRKYDQQFRSLLASIEILAAAAVANALVLGSFVRDRGAKKQRYRHHVGSLSAHSSQEQRPPARRMLTQQNWGSDADLAGELGISCAQDLQEKEPENPRPAPIALPLEKDAKNLTPMPRHQESSEITPQIMIHSAGPSSSQAKRQMEMPNTPTKAAFFDIGGLLADDKSPPRSRQQSVTGSQVPNFSRPTSPLNPNSGPLSRPTCVRTGSDTFLEDVGGLPSAGRPSSAERPSMSPRGLSLVDILRESNAEDVRPSERAHQSGRGTTPEIQDAGGLLQ